MSDGMHDALARADGYDPGDGDPLYVGRGVFMGKSLDALIESERAAARAEVAATVHALVDEYHERLGVVSVDALRAAVSDSGVANHNQQMRSEGAKAERADIWAELGQRHAPDWVLNLIDARAEAAGDQHHHGGDE